MKPGFIFIFLLLSGVARAQHSQDESPWYPMGETPILGRLMTSYTPAERIFMESNPHVRYSLFNNFLKGFREGVSDHLQAWYVSFQPQIRIYKERSVPVKTPSHKVSFGTQHLYRLKHKPGAFAGFMAESGHYSNGQNRCAFSELYPEGSPECDSIYRLITPSTRLSEILNRNSGNFSTNFTEIGFHYRRYGTGKRNGLTELHALSLGYTIYHRHFLWVARFGGYPQGDLAIIGRHRFTAEYEFSRALPGPDNRRISLKQKLEWIVKPHPSVNPLRSETLFTVYPFHRLNRLGITGSFIYGHDNYNYRLVDAGSQLSLGLSWSQLPELRFFSGKH